MSELNPKGKVSQKGKVFISFADIRNNSYQRTPMRRYTSDEYKAIFTPKYVMLELTGLVLFIGAIIKQM